MENPDRSRTFADQLLGAFGTHVDRSAQALVAVLENAAFYCIVDDDARQLVIDRRALLLSMLFVGTHKSYSTYASTASWFADWLKSRLPGRPMEPALGKAGRTRFEILDLWENGYKLTLSRSVVGEMVAASELAVATMNQREAKLRHLFVAMLIDPKHSLEIDDLRWRLLPGDRRDLCDTLMRHIAAEPEPGENVAVWTDILNRARGEPSSAPGELTAPSPAPAFLLSGFTPDRSKYRGKDDPDSPLPDPLGTQADVEAMARLICHEDADPPISIGIFGGWGSGKSTFMERLQDEIFAMGELDSPGAGGARFVSPVVQIRFNAWQFADADLWASLTAEFFDQLRAGGFKGQGNKIHARLIEDVNQHVRGLSQAAASSRAALTAADEKLRKAKLDRAQALADQKLKVGQAAVSAMVEAYQHNRGQLLRLGLLPGTVDGELRRFVEIAREANSQWGQAKVIARTLKAHWLITLALSTAVAALAYAASRSWGGWGALAAAAATTLPLAAAFLRTTRALIGQLSPLAAKLREADDAGLDTVLKKELILRAAEDEAEALRDAAARADRALARYVDPEAPSNPPRLLRYLLEDDPETRLFEREVGLMGRARRLFEALDRIVQERQSGAADENVPARIILYIDDLDRCTHEQVYKVLQAVHLLLAFRLFVVIVAVDVKWVEGAVEKHLLVAGGDPDPEQQDKRGRSIEYLSKIFQLPFWLKPLSGRNDVRFAAYVESLTGPGIETRSSRPPPTEGSSGLGPGAPDIEGSSGEGITSAPASEGYAASGESVRKARREPRTIESALKTLELDALEVRFLASQAIAAIASPDPRGVKRLVNVYKIARSRLSEIDDAMILGSEDIPPSYPLIALIAAIETGQPYVKADGVYARLRAGEGTELLGQTSGEWDEPIRDAVAAAIEERCHDVTFEEVLKVARVVRRYSFNRYH